MTQPSNPTQSSAHIMVATGAVLTAIVTGAVVVSIMREDIASIAAAIPVVGIVAFTGIYLETRRMRHAIAGSVFLLYFTLLGLSFNTRVQDAFASYNQLNELYDTFTPLVGTIAAFYLGTETFERVADTKAGVSVAERPLDAAARSVPDEGTS